jgi:hypothetical protein
MQEKQTPNKQETTVDRHSHHSSLDAVGEPERPLEETFGNVDDDELPFDLPRD